MNQRDKNLLNKKTSNILPQWNQWLEILLNLLGLGWLILIILELSIGLSPFLQTLSLTIWFIFIFDFIIRFSLAPLKLQYITSNWISLLALIIPAFRIFRGFQFLRVMRSVYLLRVTTSIKRGMKILGMIFERHGFGYIIGLTLIVILMGAAGMKALESQFKTYGDALWWTAMIITTMGTDFWPQTPEGRLLCLGLAIYAFAIFGYITAAVASFLIEKDKRSHNENQMILEAIRELKAQIETKDKK